MKNTQRKQRTPEGPRKAAWRILLAWESGNHALEALRDGHFKKARPEPRDRALITELTQGTVRHLLFLDHCVQRYLDRPDLTLPAPVSIALRLGAYQLIHLHKIPARAAVNETVQVIKDSRYRRFSSLVNAVLRRIAERGPVPVPTWDDEPLRHIELATSTPGWLVQRIAGLRSPEEALRIFQSLNRTPPLTLRVNTTRTGRVELLRILDEAGVAASPGKLADSAVTLDDRAHVWELPLFREGLCTIQDEGAQLIVPLLTPEPGQKVLDACAAPGGKTGHLAQLMAGQGLIIAADRNHGRLRMMVENLKRLGASNVRFLTADLAADAAPFSLGVFDRVLLDAPCSGTGVLRRHPEGKWKKDTLTISRMTEIQADLLVSVARLLIPGGRLLYTTCSLLEEENEKVVDRFLGEHAAMDRLDMRDLFPGMRPDIFNERGELRLWPHIHDCDGFYACLMEKR